MKDHLAWFSDKKNGWWRATPSTWNFGSTGPRWSEIADFKPIFVHIASAVTPSEKRSINTNRKSTTRFPMSLRRSLYVADKPPKGGTQKCSTAVFGVKSYKFRLIKSATEFLCVKSVNDKVVRHSLQCLKKHGFLKKPNPAGFLGYNGFYWAMGFLGFFPHGQMGCT